MAPIDQGVLNEDELLDEITSDFSTESSAIDISSELSLNSSIWEGLEPATSKLRRDTLFLFEKDFYVPFYIQIIYF